MDAKKLIEVIESANYEARWYSGRGMYGKDCVGITIPQGVSQFSVGVELAAMFETLGYEDLLEDFTCERVAQDSLGMGSIVYFPNVGWPAADDLEDEDDEPGDDSAGETEPGRSND